MIEVGWDKIIKVRLQTIQVSVIKDGDSVRVRADRQKAGQCPGEDRQRWVAMGSRHQSSRNREEDKGTDQIIARVPNAKGHWAQMLLTGLRCGSVKWGFQLGAQ